MPYSCFKFSPKYHFTDEEMDLDSLYYLMEEGKLSEYIPRVMDGLYGDEYWNTDGTYISHMNSLAEAEQKNMAKNKKAIRFAEDVKTNDGPALPSQLVVELCDLYSRGVIINDKEIEFFLEEKQVDSNTLQSMYNIFYNALERLYKLRSDLYYVNVGGGKKIKRNIPFIMNGGSNIKINVQFIPAFEYISKTLHDNLHR